MKRQEKMIIKHKQGVYERYVKRCLDFGLSLIALIILSPLLVVLTIIGTFAMGGNPFFVQERPGKDEKIFKLIKFRTMTNKKDKQGKFLSDEQRLTGYGKLLRKTSLDELPELVNILLGSLSICGPRPLMPSYLPYFTDNERHRHDVRPGLTGLAQVNGRSFISWEEIFEYDLKYVSNITFLNDLKIIFMTVGKVLERKNIADVSQTIVDEDGNLYITENGKKKRLHQPLDIERRKKEYAERDRK